MTPTSKASEAVVDVKTEEMTAKERRRLYMQRWRENNRDKTRATYSKWLEENAEHRKAYMAAFNKVSWADPENQAKSRSRHMYANYRLRPEGFNALWKDQDGKCAICEHPLSPKGKTGKSATVDHNHETGEVRGILCGSCNRGIGSLGDDPEILQRAADYLMKNGHYAPAKRTK